MKILSITAGAAGMYCVSCSRDNALAVGRKAKARAHRWELKARFRRHAFESDAGQRRRTAAVEDARRLLAGRVVGGDGSVAWSVTSIPKISDRSPVSSTVPFRTVLVRDRSEPAFAPAGRRDCSGRVTSRFAPRFGLVWLPGTSGRTVVNAGFGVFLNQWAYSVQQALAQTLPFFFAKTVTAPADAAQPTVDTSTVLLAAPNGTVSGNTMDWDYRTEYAKSYSVSVQHQITPPTMVKASALRSVIAGADSSTVLNVPEPGPGPLGPRRPVPELSNITAIRWDGYSIFNGVTFRAEQRLSRGLAVTAFYTLSKAIDDASDPGATAFESNLPQDVRNMAAERAVASFDHRHRFVASFTYALPDVGGRGAAAKVGSGWQVNGIVVLESGAPFTANLGTDRANIGAGPAQRPDMVCDPNALDDKTAQQWFNTACFTLPAPFTFGNARRNAVQAPGYANVDAAIQKGSPWAPARACSSGGTFSIF